MNTLRRFWNDDSGPELVEWAVVTIILLVAAVILYIAVGRVLGGVICSIYCWLEIIQDSGRSEGATRESCDNQENDCV